MLHSVPTAEQLQRWPATVDVPTAGRCYGLGRDASYEAARRGDLPGVVRLGRRLVVVTATLRQALGVPDPRSAVDHAGDLGPEAA